MKKFGLLLSLFFLPALSHASLQDPLVAQEKTYVVHFTTAVPANTSLVEFDLISLSTTASLFPHTRTNPGDIGEIDVSEINLVEDKVQTSTITLKLGVMQFVNISTGSVTWFFTRSSAKNGNNTDAVAFNNYPPSFYRCKVIPANTVTNSSVDGTTPWIVSNDIRSGYSGFTTTTTLISPIPAGRVAPRAGDIIMEVSNPDATNVVNIYIDVWYHAEP